jgi:hypothetical protein
MNIKIPGLYTLGPISGNDPPTLLSSNTITYPSECGVYVTYAVGGGGGGGGGVGASENTVYRAAGGGGGGSGTYFSGFIRLSCSSTITIGSGGPFGPGGIQSQGISGSDGDDTKFTKYGTVSQTLIYGGKGGAYGGAFVGGDGGSVKNLPSVYSIGGITSANKNGLTINTGSVVVAYGGGAGGNSNSSGGMGRRHNI